LERAAEVHGGKVVGVSGKHVGAIGASFQNDTAAKEAVDSMAKGARDSPQRACVAEITRLPSATTY